MRGASVERRGQCQSGAQGCSSHSASLPCSFPTRWLATSHPLPSSRSHARASDSRGARQRCRAEPQPITIDPFAAPAPPPPPPAPKPASVRDRLSAESQAVWDSAAEQLATEVTLEPAAIQKLLERAFGWGTQAFWRGSKVEEAPSAGQVEAVLAFLKDLGIAGADLTKVVKAFPEVLACSVEGQLSASVARLQGEWKLTGDVLTRALVRRPEVLGYSLDCEGTCIGECNRCWARF